MSLTYSNYVTALANMIPLASTDASYVAILPNCIDYAEQRIYRELDLISTVSDVNAQITSGSRNLAIPGSLIVLNSMNLITPNNVAPDSANSTRNPLQRVSLEFLNFVYPGNTSAAQGQPIYYAVLDGANVRFGPVPNNNWYAEFIGTVRPAPLASGNQTTFLS